MNVTASSKTWLGKLTKLNPASGRGACQGKAPHKPLLLLSLIDLAEAGELLSATFTRTPSLVLRFRCYGSIVVDRWPTRLDIGLPFFHTGSQGFWDAFDSEGRPAGSSETCTVCELHPEFFELLGDPDFRTKARMVLVSKYFEPAERIALFESLGLESGTAELLKSERVLEEAIQAAKRKGRSAKFAVQVCSGYRFTCALTGYRCTTLSGTSIVDAAHIESWSRTQNDSADNGLALSKNAHWAFDAGLWSVDDHYRVIVNPSAFIEHGPEAFRLAFFAGRPLQFDPGAKLRPAVAALRAHRREHLGKG